MSGRTLRAVSLRSLLHSPVAWVAAGLVAVAGGVAYLVIGGTLWWWLGLAAVAPLVGLMFGRLSEDGDGWPPATGAAVRGVLLELELAGASAAGWPRTCGSREIALSGWRPDCLGRSRHASELHCV